MSSTLHIDGLVASVGEQELTGMFAKFGNVLSVDIYKPDTALSLGVGAVEMASLGAKVLQARSVEFAKKYGVTVHVRSTFKVDPGTLVTKDEILGAVWPDVAVTDNALTQLVSELRQTLGALHFPPRQVGGGLGLLQLRFGSGQLRLIGARVDLEQHLALADAVALVEGDPADVAGDPRADLDGVHSAASRGRLRMSRRSVAATMPTISRRRPLSSSVRR